jgi:hypothetical protein
MIIHQFIEISIYIYYSTWSYVQQGQKAPGCDLEISNSHQLQWSFYIFGNPPIDKKEELKIETGPLP